jgi:hypothetical protein
MMDHTDVFAGRLHIAPQIPQALRSIEIHARFTPEAVNEGRALTILDALEWPVSTLGGLFSAGFASFAAPAPVTAALSQEGETFSIRIEGGPLHPFALWCVLRLLASAATLPPDAFEQLVSLMEGDEEAAREAFSPRFITDYEAISCSVTGEGALVGFDAALVFETAPLLAGAAQLMDQIASACEAGKERLLFELPRAAELTPALEDGFLALQCLGVFADGPPAGISEADPELFLQTPQQLVVTDWEESALGIVALVATLCGGDLGGVYLRDAD